MKTLLTILFGATLIASCGQTSNNVNNNKNAMTTTRETDTMKTINYEKTIDSFVVAFKNPEDASLHNGPAAALVPMPKDDNDALTTGLNLTHTYEEQNGNWKILFAKNILLEDNNIKSRAVLYEYKNKQYIAYYYKWEETGQYYFKIYTAEGFSK